MSRRTILRCGCLQVQGEHRAVDGDAVAARRLCDLLVLYSDRSRCDSSVSAALTTTTRRCHDWTSLTVHRRKA